MPFAQRPGARIWWDQDGTGDPILLIMGHAYGADMRHRTAPELAASYRVIRFDNRGAGRSSLLTRVRSLLPAAALNRMAWKLLYGPDTPAGRRAEDQQIVRRTRCSGRGRRGQLTGAAGFDVTGRLAEIRVPTLVMHGARDRIVPAANAQRLADGIAGARLVMFPDAGHAYITDVAQAANQEVLHFLAGISGPAGSSSTGTRPATSTVDT